MKVLSIFIALALIAPAFAFAAPDHDAKAAVSSASAKSSKAKAKAQDKGSKKAAVKVEAKVKSKAAPVTPKTQPRNGGASKPLLAAKPEASSPALRSSDEEALAKLPAEERLRLQVFLDRALFAPGKVDGMAGEFTLKAANRWRAVNADGSMESLVEAARKMKAETTTSFEIPGEAARFVGNVPPTLEDKAAAERLPYNTLAEYVAERFHTDEAALARLNPELKMEALASGMILKVPNVVPFKIEAPRLDSKPAGRVEGGTITILHLEHMMEVRDMDGQIAAAFPITVGNKPEHVRSGMWKVDSITANPTFMWDDEMLKNGVAGTKQYLLPPGPNNPVGVLWLELQPVKGPLAHIGIHGTTDPTHIGRNHSSGCIRLANWDVVRLARLVGAGTKVAWKGEPATAPLLAKNSDTKA